MTRSYQRAGRTVEPLARGVRHAALAFLGVLCAAQPSWAKDPSDDDLRNAVVRVDVSRAGHDFTAPWKLLPTESIFGTGFLVEGNHLLTNAHVVRDAQQVTVKKNDGSAPEIAVVEAADDACDLALLRVPNKSFLTGLHPLRVGDLPLVGSSVVTYGFPLGGRELSTTAGVVSRIEDHPYGDGISHHLVVQTDAAINPGNSGGPVLQRGSVVGVSFQGISSAQSIGYFIPAPVVHHFLDDLADGHYSGFPDLPLRAPALTSPAYRKERRLPADRSGVVVQEVATGSDLDGKLSTGDVLMAIDGKRVSDDGTCQLGPVRVQCSHLVDMKSIGQKVHFDVWRDGKAVGIDWTASRFPRWDRWRRSGAAPRYLVHGGLLFVPATLEYVDTLRPAGPRRAAILHEVAFRAWEPPVDPDHEMVLLAHVFSSPVSAGMDVWVPAVVERVNGQSVRNLADLARILDEGNSQRDVFEFGPFRHVEVVDREQARAVRASVLSNYGITNDKNL